MPPRVKLIVKGRHVLNAHRMKRLVFSLALTVMPFSTLPCAASAAAAEKPAEVPVVFVKGGCFTMGDTFGDGGNDEKPGHEVCVSDFYLGKYEVTQAQWRSVMEGNPSRHQEDDRLPVENVSWNEAQLFVKNLRQATGKPWQLPTEAQWEYAARSGGRSEKYPGTGAGAELGDFAWFADNAAGKTHPVGTKKPNGLWLHDMAGNVWEWVRDRYDRDYFRQSPRQDPKGDPFGVNRIIKGGSINQETGFLRASYRDYLAPENRGDSVGLRLALPAE